MPPRGSKTSFADVPETTLVESDDSEDDNGRYVPAPKAVCESIRVSYLDPETNLQRSEDVFLDPRDAWSTSGNLLLVNAASVTALQNNADKEQSFAISSQYATERCRRDYLREQQYILEQLRQLLKSFPGIPKDIAAEAQEAIEKAMELADTGNEEYPEVSSEDLKMALDWYVPEQGVDAELIKYLKKAQVNLGDEVSTRLLLKKMRNANRDYLRMRDKSMEALQAIDPKAVIETDEDAAKPQGAEEESGPKDAAGKLKLIHSMIIQAQNEGASWTEIARNILDAAATKWKAIKREDEELGTTSPNILQMTEDEMTGHMRDYFKSLLDKQKEWEPRLVIWNQMLAQQEENAANLMEVKLKAEMAEDKLTRKVAASEMALQKLEQRKAERQAKREERKAEKKEAKRRAKEEERAEMQALKEEALNVGSEWLDDSLFGDSFEGFEGDDYGDYGDDYYGDYGDQGAWEGTWDYGGEDGGAWQAEAWQGEAWSPSAEESSAWGDAWHDAGASASGAGVSGAGGADAASSTGGAAGADGAPAGGPSRDGAPARGGPSSGGPVNAGSKGGKKGAGKGKKGKKGKPELTPEQKAAREAKRKARDKAVVKIMSDQQKGTLDKYESASEKSAKAKKQMSDRMQELKTEVRDAVELKKKNKQRVEEAKQLIEQHTLQEQQAEANAARAAEKRKVLETEAKNLAQKKTKMKEQVQVAKTPVPKDLGIDVEKWEENVAEANEAFQEARAVEQRWRDKEQNLESELEEARAQFRDMQDDEDPSAGPAAKGSRRTAATRLRITRERETDPMLMGYHERIKREEVTVPRHIQLHTDFRARERRMQKSQQLASEEEAEDLLSKIPKYSEQDLEELLSRPTPSTSSQAPVWFRRHEDIRVKRALAVQTTAEIEDVLKVTNEKVRDLKKDLKKRGQDLVHGIEATSELLLEAANRFSQAMSTSSADDSALREQLELALRQHQACTTRAEDAWRLAEMGCDIGGSEDSLAHEELACNVTEEDLLHACRGIYSVASEVAAEGTDDLVPLARQFTTDWEAAEALLGGMDWKGKVWPSLFRASGRLDAERATQDALTALLQMEAKRKNLLDAELVAPPEAKRALAAMRSLSSQETALLSDRMNLME